jgi:hypothetical protein
MDGGSSNNGKINPPNETNRLPQSPISNSTTPRDTSSTPPERMSEWEDRHLHGQDSDARSQSSHPSDHGESGGGQPIAVSSIRSLGSVGSHGSRDHRGFPLHGNVHFGDAMAASHLLHGDATHLFPPSMMYHASADAPKSDAATVCSGSVVEDIEEESLFTGEAVPNQQAAARDYHSLPPSSLKMPPATMLRRSNSDEGNRLVDFADRSQVTISSVVPHQQRSGHATTSEWMSGNALGGLPGTANYDDDADFSLNSLPHGKAIGMGPPLSRNWLLNHGGASPSRAGSVKSIESNAGSDVVAHVGSDCGGSLTDAQSNLSQEDAAMIIAHAESAEAVAASGSTSGDVDEDSKPPARNQSQDPDDGTETKNPHPFLRSQPDSQNGRTSPGGTIYRGRGVRRYKGRFMHLPLKRFHQDGVHLSSVTGQEADDTASTHPAYDRDDGEHRGWHSHSHERGSECDRQWINDHRESGGRHDHDDYSHEQPPVAKRRRSRSRSPPTAADDDNREHSFHERARGYPVESTLRMRNDHQQKEVDYDRTP